MQPVLPFVYEGEIIGKKRLHEVAGKNARWVDWPMITP